MKHFTQTILKIQDYMKTKEAEVGFLLDFEKKKTAQGKKNHKKACLM